MLARLNHLLHRKQEPIPHDGLLEAYANAAPTSGAKTYAKGCLWHDLRNGKLYINTGTLTSATWTEVGAVSTGEGPDALVTNTQMMNAIGGALGSYVTTSNLSTALESHGSTLLTSSTFESRIRNILGNFIMYGTSAPSTTPTGGPGSIYADPSSGKVYVYTGSGGWKEISFAN